MRNQRIPAFSALTWLAWLVAVQAARAADPTVASALAQLVASAPPASQVGLSVVNLDTGQPVFDHAADVPLKPASVLKLFTTAAALEHLGPAFRFHTRVYAAADEIWVIGGGDPGLGDARVADRHGLPPLHVFDDWAAALRSAGVLRCARLVLDDSIFDQQWRHPDWPLDQADRWYQAPVGGLNINDNCLDARVELAGGRVRLLVQPLLPDAFLVNSIGVGKKHRPAVLRKPERDVFEFTGTITRSDELAPAAAGRPTVFFGHGLRQALADRGIVVTGDVVRRTIPDPIGAGGRLVAEHASALPDVLWRCNTFSQNLFAECLLKALPAYQPDGTRSGASGSWATGVAAERAILSRLGVDLDGAVLRDGSGLSHENRVTARQITTLLALLRRHRAAELFIGSLAAPGEEGSMRRSFGDPELRGRMRGKTGTLAGVRALAGYVDRPDGSTWAFALLCNGSVGPELTRRVVEVLADTDGPAPRR